MSDAFSPKRSALKLKLRVVLAGDFVADMAVVFEPGIEGNLKDALVQVELGLRCHEALKQKNGNMRSGRFERETSPHVSTYYKRTHAIVTAFVLREQKVQAKAGIWVRAHGDWLCRRNSDSQLLRRQVRWSQVLHDTEHVDDVAQYR